MRSIHETRNQVGRSRPSLSGAALVRHLKRTNSRQLGIGLSHGKKGAAGQSIPVDQLERVVLQVIREIQTSSGATFFREQQEYDEFVPAKDAFIFAREPPASDNSDNIDKRAFGFAPGARAEALLRGREIAEEDLKLSGGAFELDQVRHLMHHVSRQSVEKKLRDQMIFSVQGPENKRFYPVVQFKDDGNVIDGLQSVLKALATRNGFGILNFLVQPDDRLNGRKPIDVLKSGEIDLVVQAARAIGEQGA